MRLGLGAPYFCLCAQNSFVKLKASSLFPNMMVAKDTPSRTATSPSLPVHEAGAEHDEELAILRECCYAVMGIGGDRIQFHEGTVRIAPATVALARRCVCSNTSVLGSGALDAMNLCGHAGQLYRNIQAYTRKEETTNVVAMMGSTVRAFRCALDSYLEEYQHFCATLQPNCLRRIVRDIQSPLSKLKIIDIVVAGAIDLRGVDLLLHLHRHATMNHQRHGLMLHELLQKACTPWFRMLYQWTAQGVWTDPANEFFVQSNPGVQDRDLWLEGYQIDRKKLPHFLLDHELATLSFTLGKGVNYIRRCLKDCEWSLFSNNENTSSLVEIGFVYPLHGNKNILRATLRTWAAAMNSHILRLLRNDCGLTQHFFALKQFLLLGQGDFYSSLIDAIHSEYHSYVGINGIYRHNLAAIVESAIVSTNASGFPLTVLERLQTVVLPDHDARYVFAPKANRDTPEVGSETVWDIFMLEYVIPDPLVAIVSSRTMDTYKRLFRFLFGLKKAEFVLDYTWRQSSGLSRALHTNAQHLVVTTNTNEAYAQAIILLRQVAITRQSMVHFLCNVKSYLMFEVLEGGWKSLLPALENAETLDEVVAAHNAYLKGIFRKSLIYSSEEPMDDLNLSGKLENLLHLTGKFCSYQEDLFAGAFEAADRAAEKRREAEALTDQGAWGFHREKEASEQESCFGLSDTTKLNELDELTREFNEEMFALLQALDSKLNRSPAWTLPANPGTPSDVGDTQHDTVVDIDDDDLGSLRFLASQLDHNSFYGVTRF